MALGVPENEVYAAADAVLARGERPTVERVRLELGRGSPARVGSLLDKWWTRLADRLNSETRLPELPGPVALAFVAVWQQAMHLAQGVAESSLDGQRQVLDAERERVAAVEDRAQKDSAQFRQQTTDAVAGRQAGQSKGLQARQSRGAGRPGRAGDQRPGQRIFPAPLGDRRFARAARHVADPTHSPRHR